MDILLRIVVRQGGNALLVALAIAFALSHHRKVRAQTPDSATTPYYDYATHRVGNLTVSINNEGYASMGEYPKHSSLRLFNHMALWIGAISRGDTLVTGYTTWNAHREFNPGGYPSGKIVFRSINKPPGALPDGSVSEDDQVATYSDTLTGAIPPIQFLGKLYPHTPLGISVTQESFAWSYKYADDFVLFRFKVLNIGKHKLSRVFVGFHMLPEARFTYSGISTGEVTGFLNDFPRITNGSNCPTSDTLRIAWGASVDGVPFNNQWQERPIQVGDAVVQSVRSIIGHTIFMHNFSSARFDEYPALSFNWYTIWGVRDTIDFGPRLRGDNRRNSTGFFGAPVEDNNAYYLMQNGEIDYPSIYTATISQYDLVWQYPNQRIAPLIADGQWLANLLSVGPFDLYPGEEMEIPYAIVAGENFHVYPNNGDNLPYNPQQWMKNVDFSDLAKNALWAQWVYDNPGVDTDGDGYRGEYHICVTDSVLVGGNWTVAKAETTYYRGDGVPDWKGAQPPPAPKVWVEPKLNGVRIRWNGSRSETEKDPFLQAVDFEGYHVYFGRDNRDASMQLIANYDRQNYDKYVFIPVPNDSGLWETSWEVQNIPFTLEELRCLYGTSCDDSSFDPENYSTSNPYRNPSVPDSIFYFTKHDFNTSRLGIDTDIRKVYPDTRDPSTVHPDSLTPDDYTSDSLLKFYEYELVIPNLLPSVSYYASVTAYDFGSPPSGLQALETSKMADIKTVYPYINPGDEDELQRKVYIYPNPYRSDAGYRADGLESRGRDEDFVDRVRQIHFNNLPHKCTIRIFTLDGDLIREIDHDKSPDDPTAHHDTFSMINRNGMIIVTGLYYWTVESPDSKVQMGKLVVIM